MHKALELFKHAVWIRITSHVDRGGGAPPFSIKREGHLSSYHRHYNSGSAPLLSPPHLSAA